MYIPAAYQNSDLEEVKEFIKKNSFGLLINQTNGKPWATHIPLELYSKNGKDFLISHISKANPQWHNFKENPDVLCIFNGPHSYISSSWYKEEEVPTWNYIAVHVYGKIKIIEGDALLDSLKDLVDKYEADSACPVSVDGFSKKTMSQIKGIVGFEIEINEIKAAYKLSQTRPEDHPKIIEELNTREQGSKEVAKMMKNKNN